MFRQTRDAVLGRERFEGCLRHVLYDNPGELFDVVDPDDRVIGQATRGEVHARGLLHRAAHVFVINSNGELLRWYVAAVG